MEQSKIDENILTLEAKRQRVYDKLSQRIIQLIPPNADKNRLFKYFFLNDVAKIREALGFRSGAIINIQHMGNKLNNRPRK